MKALYKNLALAYFVVATVALLISAFLLLGFAVWEVASSLTSAEVQVVDRIRRTVDGVGLMIIAFAVVEAGTFIAEQEVFRKRELRHPRESRRLITKFITIIVIVISLESLVMIFKTGRAQIALAIYPAALFASAMFALIALGLYQWLSSRVESKTDG